MNEFEKTIKEYLDKKAETDPAFKEKYANPGKSIKEGIRYLHSPFDCYYFEGGHNGYYHDTPREAYAALIDKISGKGTWESNPWVIVYDFELIK